MHKKCHDKKAQPLKTSNVEEERNAVDETNSEELLHISISVPVLEINIFFDPVDYYISY